MREKEEDVKRGRKNIFLILMMYMVRAFYNKSEFGLMKWSNSGVLKICTLSRPACVLYMHSRFCTAFKNALIGILIPSNKFSMVILAMSQV